MITLRALSFALVLLSALPALAASGRVLTVRLPRVVIPPHASIEVCVFVRVPRSTAFDMASFTVQHRGLTSDFSLAHFLVYAYQGHQFDGFAGEEPRVVASRGCLDVGPDDRDNRQLIASGPSSRSRGFAPAGTAIRLEPDPTAQAIGFVLDANFANGSDKPRKASSVVKLRAPNPKQLKRVLRPILDQTAEEALLVPPGTVRSTEQSTADWNAAHPSDPPLRDAWSAGGDVCITNLTGHFHKRGRFFGADFLDASGTLVPGDGLLNPFESGRHHWFGAPDYTDPGERVFSPPHLLRVGEALHYGCWIDNGVQRALRLGCEEISGVAPGGARRSGGGPAKRCIHIGPAPSECPTSDAAFPGRSFTGQCVPANLVAGTTPEDEVCQVAGFYYEAGAAGTCDLTAEAPLSRVP